MVSCWSVSGSCRSVDFQSWVITGWSASAMRSVARVVGVLGQVLLALGARDLVDAGEDALEVAVLVQELGRRLVADAGYARDVVRGVALQSVEIRDQLGRDVVAVDHRLAVVDLR